MSMTLDEFNAEIDRLCASPDRAAACIEMATLQWRLEQAGSLPLQALYSMGLGWSRLGRNQEARARAMDLFAHAMRDPVGAGNAAAAGLEIAQNLMILGDVKDERFVEAARFAAATVLRQQPTSIPAHAGLGQYLMATERWTLLGRLRRHLMQHVPTEVISGNVIAQRLVMCDGSFGPSRPERWADVSALKLITLEERRSNGQGGAIQIAGDSVYWEKFGALASKSILAGEPELALHAVVLIRGNGDVEHLRLLRSQFGHRFGYSAVSINGEGADLINRTRQARTLFACLRFLFLPQLLQLYRRPVLTLDLDIRVRRPLKPLLTRFATNSVAMTIWPGLNPWHEVGAGFLLVQPDDIGHDFADYLRRYLARLLAEGHGYWTLDQIALAMAIRHLRKRRQEVTVVPPVEARRHILYAGQFDGTMGPDDKVRQLRIAAGEIT